MPNRNDYQNIRESLLSPLFSRTEQEERAQKASELALATTREREKTLTKPAGSLGRLEQLSEHLAFWQGKSPPILKNVRVMVFAGKHGICSEGVSAYPSVVTEQMVANFRNGGAAINQLCKTARAELQVETVFFEKQTASFLHEPAMSSDECAESVKKGIDCIEGIGRVDLLALGEMGIGNSSSAAAILYALYGDKAERDKTERDKAEQWVGTGTGLVGEEYRHKIEVIEKAVMRFNQKHGARRSNDRTMMDAERAWNILRELGGYELAAIVGALLKARALRIPTLLDGFPCCAAAAIAKTLEGESLTNCLLAHRSEQRGFSLLQKKLERGEPILDLRMRLGEGSGAALAILVLRAAVACHGGMASFETACVDDRLPEV